MSYTWQGENWGRSLIVDAIKAGYVLRVKSEDDLLYEGNKPNDAWEAVTSVDESCVFLHKDGARVELAYLVLEKDQAGDEVICDHTTGGWIEKWWDAKFAASGG